MSDPTRSAQLSPGLLLGRLLTVGVALGGSGVALGERGVADGDGLGDRRGDGDGDGDGRVDADDAAAVGDWLVAGGGED